MALPPETSEGLYVHVPFCFHKCHYCDFYSITRQNEQRMGKFVDRILAEADCWVEGQVGATPPPADRLLRRRHAQPAADDTDAATDRRPARPVRSFGTGGMDRRSEPRHGRRADYCAVLRELGVDRLSFGAQSFDRAELRSSGAPPRPRTTCRQPGGRPVGGFRPPEPRPDLRHPRPEPGLLVGQPGSGTRRWARRTSPATA